MKTIKILLSIPLLFACCIFTSCDNDEESGTATLSVRLHDQPAAIDSALVEIIEVRVHVADTGWLTLNTDTGIYDLLLLQNGVDTLLVPPQLLPAGKLSQIRFILGDDNRVVVDSISYPLLLSSQDESGLKLNLHETIQAGQQYVLSVDFDAAQSIIQQGNGSYRLKPVLKATLQ